MRAFVVIRIFCTVSLFSCRFVKSLNDTNIGEKSADESKDTETTTIVTKTTRDTEATKNGTTYVTDSADTNSTAKNVTDKINKNNDKISMTEETEDYWMSVRGSIPNDLMDVQAILVKDEELTKQCQTANLKAKTRYLMCGGSVLSDHHVLTSASCLHEATHIRHNIKAPLAIVVAPVKNGSQIIRVQDYVIHPKHVADPYGSNYLSHNLAILKLSCRIKSHNLKKIIFPESPFAEICGDENCMVALLRKLGKSSYQMQEITVEDIPLSRRKRDPSAALASSTLSSGEDVSSIDKKTNNRKIRKLINPPRFDSSLVAIDTHKANGSWRNSNEIDNTKKAYIQNKIGTSTVIPEKNTRKIKTIDKSIIDNDRAKSIMERASDGVNRCPQVGSPVMYDNVQTAVVSVSCDDRQPSKAWGFTDLFSNIDWIKQVVEDWKRMDKNKSHTIKKGSCNTCIFNIYVSNDRIYEDSRKPDCDHGTSMYNTEDVETEDVRRPEEIVAPSNSDNPTETYSNFAGERAPQVTSGVAPSREYRSNVGSIEKFVNDYGRSTMIKYRNENENRTREVDTLLRETKGETSKTKDEPSYARDKTLSDNVKFWNMKDSMKSMKNYTHQDTQTDEQTYDRYRNNKSNLVPVERTLTRNGEKFENLLSPFVRSIENRAASHRSAATSSSNGTSFDASIRGYVKDRNSNDDRGNQEHVILVKLRIVEPRYDTSRGSNDVGEAILKNISVTIDGARSRNSEIYVNGESLENSVIHVYGETTQNSRGYGTKKNFRSSSEKNRNYRIHRGNDKSITRDYDRFARYANTTDRDVRSYVANGDTAETRNHNKGYSDRHVEFTNVDDPTTARERDMRALLRKNRQKGKD